MKGFIKVLNNSVSRLGFYAGMKVRLSCGAIGKIIDESSTFFKVELRYEGSPSEFISYSKKTLIAYGGGSHVTEFFCYNELIGKRLNIVMREEFNNTGPDGAMELIETKWFYYKNRTEDCILFTSAGDEMSSEFNVNCFPSIEYNINPKKIVKYNYIAR